ncbi:nitroreductase family protein [soil metagenome]
MSVARFVRPASWFTPKVSAEQAAREFYEVMRQRRSVRMFSPRPVSRETIELLVQSATSAPSGANKQPWRFVCVQDPDLKRQIRLGAEEEEREFYSRRAGEKWLKDLEPLGTDENKSFLEIAPWLIVVFKLAHADDAAQVYYVNEAVGIAVGMLLSAAQHAGLATLTHTPSPMKFLAKILGRPENERPFLLIPIGYAADNLVVPEFAIQRKQMSEVMIIDRGLASRTPGDHA